MRLSVSDDLEGEIMLGLPKSTELNKPLPKTAIYTKFQMNAAEKDKIDADISRIVIVNEVSAAKLNLAPGESVQAFFVLQVTLKHREFSEKTLITLSKLIPQNMVLLLECDGQAKLAVYHTKLLQTPWRDPADLTLAIKGLTMDAVWENVIVQVGNIRLQTGNTLDQQIAIDEQRAKLEKEIARLEKLAWAEKQKLEQNLTANCIPQDIFEMDYTQFEDFLEKRRKLMAQKIRNYYEMLK